MSRTLGLLSPARSDPAAQEEIQRHKYRYCIHKDELVIGIGRPWVPESTRKRTNNAYPRVIGNLGMLAPDNEGKIPINMLKYMYHFARSLREKKAIIRWFGIPGEHDPPLTHTGVPITHPDAIAFKKEDKLNIPRWLSIMADQIPVGFANTLGWAHANTGDTMVTVMIGGLRTVMNGDFEVFPGDLIQWYWPFEKNCFRAGGERKPYSHTWTVAGGRLIPPNLNPEFDVELNNPDGFEPQGGSDRREAFYARGFGNPSEKQTKLVPRVKPYVPDDDNPRIFDAYRVFAVALAAARPHEMLDIKISRQSV